MRRAAQFNTWLAGTYAAPGYDLLWLELQMVTMPFSTDSILDITKTQTQKNLNRRAARTISGAGSIGTSKDVAVRGAGHRCLANPTTMTIFSAKETFLCQPSLALSLSPSRKFSKGNLLQISHGSRCCWCIRTILETLFVELLVDSR